MGTGYTRNDTANNIADGNVINASDLDGEFDAIQSAFNGSTGHSHDGTTGEGPQIDTAGIADDAVTGAKIDSTTTVTAASFVGPLTGNVTGNVTGTVSGNAGTATKLATARSIGLSGDVSGSANFDGSANISITATVADDSHNHVISNVDGLQTALDGKLTTSTTFGGDVSGTYNAIVVANDSHTHDGRYFTETESDARYCLEANNLSDLTSASTARTNLGLGSLATLSTVNAATITDNSVGAAELNVSGNGTSGQYLISDGDGTMSWYTLSIPSSIPSGTVMLFVQSTAPTGWTKSTTHNNKALRVVSGTVSSGGNAAFTTAFASYTPSGNVSVAGSVSMSGNIGSTTLSINQIPSHSHSYVRPENSLAAGGNFYQASSSNANTGNAGGGGSHNHNHNLSGSLTVNSSSFSGNAKDLAVQYVDVIIATKD